MGTQEEEEEGQEKMRLWEDIDNITKLIQSFKSNKIDSKTFSQEIESEMQNTMGISSRFGQLVKAIVLLNGNAPEILQNSDIPILLPDVLDKLNPEAGDRPRLRKLLKDLEKTALGRDVIEEIAQKRKNLNNPKKRKPPTRAEPDPKPEETPKPKDGGVGKQVSMQLGSMGQEFNQEEKKDLISRFPDYREIEEKGLWDEWLRLLMVLRRDPKRGGSVDNPRGNITSPRNFLDNLEFSRKYYAKNTGRSLDEPLEPDEVESLVRKHGFKEETEQSKPETSEHEAQHDWADPNKEQTNPQDEPKSTEETPMPDQPVQPMTSRMGQKKYPLAKVMYASGDMAIVRVMGEVNLNGKRAKKLTYVQVPLEEVDRARKTGNMEAELWNYIRHNYYLKYLEQIKETLKAAGVSDEILNNPEELRTQIDNMPRNDESYAQLAALKTTYKKRFSDNSLEAVQRLHSTATEDLNPENFTQYLRTYIGTTPEESLMKSINRMAQVKPNPADQMIAKYVLMMNSDQKDRFFSALEKVIKSRRPFNQQNIQKYLNSVWQRKSRGTPALGESLAREDLLIESEIHQNFKVFLEAPFGRRRKRRRRPIGRPQTNQSGGTFSPEDYKLAERGLLYSLIGGALRSNPRTILNFAQKFGILEPRDNVQAFEAEREAATQPNEQQVQAEVPAATERADKTRQKVEDISAMLQDPQTEAQLAQVIPQNMISPQNQTMLDELKADPAGYLASMTQEAQAGKNDRQKFLNWMTQILARSGMRATKVNKNRARRAAQQQRLQQLNQRADRTKQIRQNPLGSLQSRNYARRAQAELAGLTGQQESLIRFDDVLSEALVGYDILPDRIVDLDPFQAIYLNSPNLDKLEEARLKAHKAATTAIDSCLDNKNQDVIGLVVKEANEAFMAYTKLLLNSDLSELIYTPLNEDVDPLSELIRYSKLTCSPKTQQGWKSLTEYHKNPQKSARQMKNTLMWIRGPSKII